MITTRKATRLSAPPLIAYLFAAWAGFVQTLKDILGVGGYVSVLINVLPLVVLMAWIATRVDSPTVLQYILVVGFFLVVWYNTVFRMGNALGGEFWLGTLELTIISRTPLMVVMLGKCLAIALYCTISAVIAFLAMVLVSQKIVSVADPVLLVCSALLTMFAIISISFIFVPLMVLVRGEPGFYNGIRPLGMLFSGFLFPVSRLPEVIQPVAGLLPTSWAMNGVIRALEGGHSLGSIGSDWGAALVLSFAYFGITWWLFRVVERRVRVLGTLTTS